MKVRTEGFKALPFFLHDVSVLFLHSFSIMDYGEDANRALACYNGDTTIG